MRKRELEALMKLNGDTGSSLAEYLGMARSTFSAKLNRTNKADFTVSEIRAIKVRYNLTADQVDNIFFNTEVSK